MITTGGVDLKIWDANSGELLKTLEGFFYVHGLRMEKYSSPGDLRLRHSTQPHGLFVHENLVDTISISPNERILASTKHLVETVRQWNLETNQSIATPLYHENPVNCATFSADGKFLVTGCDDGDIHIWDVSAIIKEVGLPSNIADATPRPAPKIKGTRRIPPGFFNDALQEAHLSRLRTHPSQSELYVQHNRPTSGPRQHTFSRFFFFWRRSKPHRAIERDSQTRSHPLSWARNVVSGMLRRGHGSDMEMREPPVVEDPYTAIKPALSRDKEKTSSQLISTSQHSYYATIH
ncbi:quinon protein alcohol dehydrogenase-like superfamily [Suillus subaureus]|uniref:Quinon protein alcohol dehydrogenase-like superfamily n=1 Tax=Suillus subaureus TaxID=48587 RepID=A0A9P7DP34_9AGAM|nr:quinon protein alcohol dehydrogenase-like superfamily [Suillus subaureus]KAG1799553.1 quinon protein alcohol dehydrogenase-like superfamily [Suillus subaureus]